jgi:hypothetical protein
MRPTLAAGFTVVVAMASPGGARAQAGRFFFRGALGVGYGAFVTAVEGPSASIVGLGALGNFALGVTLGRGFAVHIDACAMALVTPTVTVNGRVRESAMRADSTTTLSIVGGGLTWRHRSRFWGSLSGGVAIVGVEIPDALCRNPRTGESFDCSFALTELGGGANLLVGRDWPLAYAWHIGVALHAALAAVPDQPANGVQPLWLAFGGGASLVITAQ